MPAPRRVSPIELPPSGSQGDFDRVADILARYEGNDRYFILDEVIGDHDRAEDLSAEELKEFLRCVLGSPEEVADDLDGMSDDEVVAHFPDERVREFVVLYTLSNVSPEEGEAR